MKRRHFILDTNVMMDRTLNEIVFDIRPYTVVILKPVLIELDGLKRGEGERNKKARDAINTLEKLQVGEINLRSFEEYYDNDSPFLNQDVPFSHLVFSDKRAKGSIRNFDEEIILLAEEYAQKNKDVEVVLLTGDTTMRIQARNHTSQFEICDIYAWLCDVSVDPHLYEDDVLKYSQTDDALKKAYTKRKKIRDEIAALPDSEITDDIKSALAEAESQEKEVLVRVKQAREKRIQARQMKEWEEQKVLEQATREEREALELEERRRADKRRLIGTIIIILLIAFSCLSAYHSFTSSSLCDVFGF